VLLAGNADAQLPGNTTGEAYTEKIKKVLSEARASKLEQRTVPFQLPAGWEIGMVSWITADDAGNTYLLQRGEKADPIIVLDPKGKVLHSFGAGMFKMPHSIRIDPQGNIWTADAKSSMVYKFSTDGKKLLEIAVGGVPEDCAGGFCGTTDVGFGPDGQVFVADGYKNARIIEYDKEGKKVREWGKAGIGPGEFRIPHTIVVDKRGIIYVGDRENGRVQRFDLKGNFLGEWTYGKAFSLALSNDGLWIGSRPMIGTSETPGWLIQVNLHTGSIVQYKEGVVGIHGIYSTAQGELLIAPGPNMQPQAFILSH
jgi:streptogramin lyase